jgi:putative transposase
LGVKTAFIEPGSTWEKSYIESFIGELRDELLNDEIFDNIVETRIITAQQHDITIKSDRTVR